MQADHDVVMLAGDYVTTEQGTGIVHIAPGRSPEDYELAHISMVFLYQICE